MSWSFRLLRGGLAVASSVLLIYGFLKRIGILDKVIEILGEVAV